MNDTTDAVRGRYHAMLMRRSAADRLKMGASMFDAARALMRASLGDPHGVDRSPEMRARLFLRTYGADFEPETVQRIVAHLRKSARPE